MVQCVTAIKNSTHFPLCGCQSTLLNFQSKEILSLPTVLCRGGTIWNDVQVFNPSQGFHSKCPATLYDDITLVMAQSNISTHIVHYSGFTVVVYLL